MLKREGLGGLGEEHLRLQRPLVLATGTSGIQRAKHRQGGWGEELGWSLASPPASGRTRPPGCGEKPSCRSGQRELSLRCSTTVGLDALSSDKPGR